MKASLVHSFILMLLIQSNLFSQHNGNFAPPANPPVAQAVAVNERIIIDGRLDEPAWRLAMPVDDFKQIEPLQAAAPSFGTQVRLLFDKVYLYLGAFCRDSLAKSGVRVPDLRRDFDYNQNDVFGVIFDPFRDRRNGLVFQANPFGVQRDLQVIDGQVYNVDWDDLWKVRTTITDSGWVCEMAIPWQTLRYSKNSSAEWGVNFVRTIRRKNEITGWSPWPRVYSPYRMDYAGLLQGMVPPPPARNLRARPYLAMRSNRANNSARNAEAELGGDLKWGLSSNTALDVTLNTDFAEADADRQVINLSRFSVFFPEKRQFFLENASLFDVGNGFYAATPYFSRRLGLDRFGQPIPIDAGLRLTSRSAQRSAGALLMRQRGNVNNPAGTFAIGRYVQNLGSQNRIGGLLTARHDEALGASAAVDNFTASVDGFFRLARTFNAYTMLSRSWTQGAPGDGYAAYAWLYHATNWGYIGHIQSLISKNYEATAGFVRRQDLIITSPAVTLDWRPQWKPSFVRRFRPGFTTFLYHRASDRRFQEGYVTLRPVTTQLHDGAEMQFRITPNWQNLEAQDAQSFRPFGVALAPGNYSFVRYTLAFDSDQSRRFALSLAGTVGDYFDGRLNTLSASAKISPSPHVVLSWQYEVNQARALGARRENRTTHLLGPMLLLALNPRLQTFAFYQYNSLNALSGWNLRFSWEFAPLSFMHLVFNQNDFRESGERNQSLITKVSWMRQF
ncbi:MAG: carbohydrate binding family 9 domain-containing protein [candidate division KSB1 bacterium]|nr:carbohydrate binding family 9 domain-containing protein [candidate division KSB1 bacterium]MDZ7364829.1 carbohydrate binding family 9 domain-containing protein [candidate division KSB1 bacterium]MDZ7402932.1 carbohydrate binding family 9 domain-containing protein [candidate division KSB1 bacterium]